MSVSIGEYVRVPMFGGHMTILVTADNITLVAELMAL